MIKGKEFLHQLLFPRDQNTMSSKSTDPRERNRLKREKMERNRQKFRWKVESFYKQFYPEKWEGARDLLYVKFMTNCKEFNEKLTERYGDDFKNYAPPEKVVKTAADLRAERVQKYAVNDDGSEIPEEQVANDGRMECTSCGRKFGANRIVKHEEICYKSKEKAAEKQVEEKRVESVPVPATAAPNNEDTSGFTAGELSEIEILEAQLKQLKMLKARKEAAAKANN